MLEPFDVRYRRALADPQLRANLLAFERKWRISRDLLLEGTDFEDARQTLAGIKDEVIARQPEYLARFRNAAEAAGCRVVEAATGADAVRYIADLAASRDLARVVKSKSMVSEEIDLNEGLEAAGLNVVETDLGEWIVQLAGERPAHIIGPALHKNRAQVAELLSLATGRAVDVEDIGDQVRVAQETLRQEFLSGQMGISGANAIIADTGSVMLVTNEGNAELVTSIPPVHVVLVGIEKLLPTLEDAMLELRLLASSATAQKATAYVTWITGPDRPDSEVHIVLLDNGRTAMRDSPLFEDALRCIRCGACSNICPSFGAVGGHVFGYIYSGAIGLVNTPFHHGIEHDAGPQSLCVSCNACQTVCPVDIPLPRQILDARAWAVREDGMPVPERLALEAWSRPRIIHAGLRAGAALQRPFQQGPYVHPPFVPKLTSWRTLPAIADRPFRGRWPVPPAGRLPGPLGHTLDGLTIGFFVQCLTDWLYPDMGVAIVDVLRALGAEVVFPRAQHCCGLPALDSGRPEIAKRMARATIQTLEDCAADFIVTGGTSCVVAMAHEYSHLFRAEPEWQMRSANQGARLRDFTSFMSEVARLPAGSLASGETATATYHYFCQSYNVLGFREAPLALLREVCGLDLAPLPEANVCCGFGGSVSFRRPELCSHILDRKLQNVDETGVRLLVTDNPGCIMHLRGGMDASGRAVTVKHTAEVLAEHVRALVARC